MNILLITSDDQRWDAQGGVHVAPGMSVAMPIVCSELIGKGVTFSNAFIVTPVCGPSRATSLTGQYSHNHGVLRTHGQGGFNDKFKPNKTLATWLQAAGYRTGLVGKYGNDYFEISPTIPPGWDTFCAFLETAYFDYQLNENGTINSFGTGPSNYSTDVLLERALTFIEDGPDAPWFLWFTPYGPHQNNNAPPTPAPRHVGRFAGVPLWRPPSWNETNVSDKAPWLQALPQLTAPQIALVDASRQAALETALSVDEAVGALLGLLDELEIADETVVIYQGGDNGFQWCEHRLVAKNSPYEEAIRSTFIIRHPDYPTARTDDRIVANIDLAPTIAQIAQATPDLAPINGMSLVPLLDGSPQSWRSDILIEHMQEEGHPGSRQNPPSYQGVRTATRKLVKYFDQTQGLELYDLGDPYERVNKASDPAYAADKTALLARLDELKAE